MDGVRALLRDSLSRSLHALSIEDRLEAAWLVACGRVLAKQGTIVGYENGSVRISVSDASWLEQMKSMRAELTAELARIAGVPVTGIHFVVKR